MQWAKGPVRYPLSNGGYVIIDANDVILIGGRKWFRVVRGRQTYAVANINKGIVYMHRFLLPDAFQVDHRNGNGLDNRRANIRAATPRQNTGNRPSYMGSSVYKGVTWHRDAKKWMAQCGGGIRHQYLGLFTSEIAAAKAYDRAALVAFGTFAKLNFPKEDYGNATTDSSQRPVTK